MLFVVLRLPQLSIASVATPATSGYGSSVVDVDRPAAVPRVKSLESHRLTAAGSCAVEAWAGGCTG